jgi:hypothetical protein
MAKITQYQCDGCGAVKGATNHWWLARGAEDFLVLPFNEKDTGHVGVEIFCGDNCLHRALTAWSAGARTETGAGTVATVM